MRRSMRSSSSQLEENLLLRAKVVNSLQKAASHYKSYVRFYEWHEMAARKPIVKLIFAAPPPYKESDFLNVFGHVYKPGI